MRMAMDNITRKIWKMILGKIKLLLLYTFEGLEKNVDKAIDKVRPENYKNYFKNAYIIKDDTTYKRKPSTRKCKLKNYKS